MIRRLALSAVCHLAARLIAAWADLTVARDRRMYRWRITRLRDAGQWRTRRRFNAITRPDAADMAALTRTLTDLHSEDTR